MQTPEFQIESWQPIVGSLQRSQVVANTLLHDCDLAIAIATKSVTEPPGGVVSVAHVPSGEVIFSKTSGWGDLNGD